MSFQERNVTVSLVSGVLLLGYYLARLLPMAQGEALAAANVYILWGTIIVLAVIVNILGSILSYIASNVIHAIRSGREEDLPTVADERDERIGLRGTRAAYLVCGAGTLVAMGSMVAGYSPLVMFNLLVFFGLVAEIAGDMVRLYLYRRGG